MTGIPGVLPAGTIDRGLTNLPSRQVPDYPMEERFPAHTSLGLLLRLVHQHWAQAVDAALDDAGFGDIRPPHANVFTFVPPDGIRVSELTQLAHVRRSEERRVG